MTAQNIAHELGRSGRDCHVAGLAELTLETADLEAMTRFYCELVGLEVLSSGPDRVWLAVGERTRLGLWAPGAKEFGDRGGRHVHFAFSATPGRLEELARRLRVQGVHVRGPIEHPGGTVPSTSAIRPATSWRRGTSSIARMALARVSGRWHEIASVGRVDLQPRLIDVATPVDPIGVVVLLHGGASRGGTMRVSPTQLSVLRMVPISRRVARAGVGRLAVFRLLNSRRGWDASHTPQQDAQWRSISLLIVTVAGCRPALSGTRSGDERRSSPQGAPRCEA